MHNIAMRAPGQWCCGGSLSRSDTSSRQQTRYYSSMADKRDRLNLIRELIDENVVGSQEELGRLLRHRGWVVTQSTLSRDLRELRVARVQGPEGARYTISPATANEGNGFGTLDVVLPPLFRSVDGVA